MSKAVRLKSSTRRNNNVSSVGLSKKNNIIKSATRLFSDKSFHDVTMDEIAERAKVSKGTLYRYFSSKENLYLEILEHTFDSIESILEREVAKSDSAPEKLKKLLYIIIKFYRDNIDILRILSRDETHLIREHQELTEKWRSRRLSLYEQIIKKGVAEESFKTKNTELAALILYGSIGMVMVFYDLEKSPKVVAEELYSEIASGLFH